MRLTDQEIKLNDKLIKIVKERDIACTTLALAMDKKKPNISNWINGKLVYSFKTLEKIANALDVDIKIILNKK